LPAKADALAEFKRANLAAEGSDGSDDLVTGNEGILADAPVIGDEVKITVADAAVSDGDFNLVRAELAWVVAQREQLRPRRMSRKSLNLSHNLPEASIESAIRRLNPQKAPVEGRSIDIVFSLV
jgi:hypothetical protein